MRLSDKGDVTVQIHEAEGVNYQKAESQEPRGISQEEGLMQAGLWATQKRKGREKATVRMK